jgi:hypothetical protein
LCGRADLTLGEGDDLALECQKHTGDGHHEDNRSCHDTRHKMKPEDDLAQPHG